MPYEDVPSRIDHTILGPTTTPEDVIDVLDTAIAYGLGACVPPCYVSLADSYAPGVRVSTVIGFPHGQHEPSVKAAEAERAQKAGATTVSVVCNVGRLKADEDEGVRDDIAEVVAATSLPVTVIVGAPLLTESELDRIGQLAADAGAEALATGVDGQETSIDDVERLARYLPVTASGGIDTWSEAKAMIDAGARRIGTANGRTVIEQYRTAEE